MIRRITLTIGLGLWLVLATTVAALALPGEGFDVDPYGITGGTAGTTAVEGVAATTTGFDPSLGAAVLAVAVVGAVMAILGYLLGTARGHRVLAH